VHVDTTARVSGCSGIECGDCVMNVDQYRAVTNTDITDSDQPADHHAGDVIESRDNYRHTYSRLHRVTRPVYCVTYAESEPYCHSILFVCLSVGHSTTYSLPRLIDHNQIWSARIYLSLDPCKPFWIPCLPYFRCQGKICKISPITRILATANVTHRAI